MPRVHSFEGDEELNQKRGGLQRTLEAMAVNNPFYKLALAGENKVKIFGLNDWKEIKQ